MHAEIAYLLADVSAHLRGQLDEPDELDAIMSAWYMVTSIRENLVLPKEMRIKILSLPSPMRWPDTGIADAYLDCLDALCLLFREVVGVC